MNLPPKRYEVNLLDYPPGSIQPENGIVVCKNTVTVMANDYPETPATRSGEVMEALLDFQSLFPGANITSHTIIYGQGEQGIYVLSVSIVCSNTYPFEG